MVRSIQFKPKRFVALTDFSAKFAEVIGEQVQADMLVEAKAATEAALVITHKSVKKSSLKQL